MLLAYEVRITQLSSLVQTLLVRNLYFLKTPKLLAVNRTRHLRVLDCYGFAEVMSGVAERTLLAGFGCLGQTVSIRIVFMVLNRAVFLGEHDVLDNAWLLQTVRMLIG